MSKEDGINRINRSIPEVLLVSNSSRSAIERGWLRTLTAVFQDNGLSVSVVEEHALADRIRERLGDLKHGRGYRAYIVDSVYTAREGRCAVGQIKDMVPDAYVVAASAFLDTRMVRDLFKLGAADVVTQHLNRDWTRKDMEYIISPD